MQRVTIGEKVMDILHHIPHEPGASSLGMKYMMVQFGKPGIVFHSQPPSDGDVSRDMDGPDACPEAAPPAAHHFIGVIFSPHFHMSSQSAGSTTLGALKGAKHHPSLSQALLSRADAASCGLQHDCNGVRAHV